MVVILDSTPRRSTFAWTTELTEERALLLIVLDGSLFAELSGVRLFCRGAAGGNSGAVCTTADGPAPGDWDRVGGGCLGGGGVACRVGAIWRGGWGVKAMVANCLPTSDGCGGHLCGGVSCRVGGRWRGGRGV